MTQTIAAYYDSDNNKVVFNKDIDLTGNINMTGNITAAGIATGNDVSITIQDEGQALTTGASTLNFTGGGVTASGNGATKTITVAGGSVAGSEYFQTQLTDYQTDIDDMSRTAFYNTYTIINFEGKGTQTGNTSNWNASTNSYTLDSTGLYQISFKITFPGIRYISSISLYQLRAQLFITGVVQYSTDNFSTSTTVFSSGRSGATSTNDAIQPSIVSGQYIFSPTSANTKIRLLGGVHGTGSGSSPETSNHTFIVSPYSKNAFDAANELNGNAQTSYPGFNANLPGATMFNIVRLS